MRVWLTILLIVLSAAGARAIPMSQQIIIFNGGSSASGSGGAGCTMNGIFDLTNTCNDIYFIGALR